MGLLSKLVSSAQGKIGWPWNEESPALPVKMPNGKPWPKISIVTPSFNQGQFIEETIRSVLLQNYPNLEYIIIDGGSSDNSVEIIQKYKPWLTYWISEQDKGQSHAINKGLSMCTGDIIAWLNSDDLFKSGTLHCVAANLSIEQPCWLVGGCEIEDYKRNALNIRYPPNCINKKTFLSWIENWFAQPSTFWNKKLFDIVGDLDVDLSYVMDVDLWWRMVAYEEPMIIKKVLSEYRIHDKTKTLSSLEESNSELILWSYKNFILNSDNSYEHFESILKRLIELQLTTGKLKSHSIIGRFIRFWGKYINTRFNNI